MSCFDFSVTMFCVCKRFVIEFTSTSVRSNVRFLSFAISSAHLLAYQVYEKVTKTLKHFQYASLHLSFLSKVFKDVGSPSVNMSLLFKFSVEAFSLHQLFSTNC